MYISICRIVCFYCFRLKKIEPEALTFDSRASSFSRKFRCSSTWGRRKKPTSNCGQVWKSWMNMFWKSWKVWKSLESLWFLRLSKISEPSHCWIPLTWPAIVGPPPTSPTSPESLFHFLKKLERDVGDDPVVAGGIACWCWKTRLSGMSHLDDLSALQFVSGDDTIALNGFRSLNNLYGRLQTHKNYDVAPFFKFYRIETKWGFAGKSL